MGRRQTRRGLVCYTLFSQIYAIFSNFLYFAASLDAKEGALQMSILQRAPFVCGFFHRFGLFRWKIRTRKKAAFAALPHSRTAKAVKAGLSAASNRLHEMI